MNNTPLILPRRRGFLSAAIGLLVAPAVVRADSLMTVKSMPALILPRKLKMVTKAMPQIVRYNDYDTIPLVLDLSWVGEYE